MWQAGQPRQSKPPIQTDGVVCRWSEACALLPLPRHAVSRRGVVFPALVRARTLQVKDFGDSIPGHGGLTDRMDCQLVMALFTYTYYYSFVAASSATVGAVLNMILKLPPEKQVEVFHQLGNLLEGEGLIDPAAAAAAEAAGGFGAHGLVGEGGEGGYDAGGAMGVGSMDSDEL